LLTSSRSCAAALTASVQHWGFAGRRAPASRHSFPGPQLVLSGTLRYFFMTSVQHVPHLGPPKHVDVVCSMFVLQSCKGFQPNSFHMWCCTKRQCNIQYTQQAIEDLGYPMDEDLEFLTCHGMQDETTSDQPSSGKSTRSAILFPLIGSGLAVVAILAIVLLVLWRHKRQQRANRMKADEMQMQIGKYMQQLEKHREKSRNEQAELQKVKMQYKMLEMDLLANTASGKTASAKAPSDRAQLADAAVRRRA
jgi:hypothetical protein